MKKYILLIVLFFAGLILSAIHPHDYFTWMLEVFPAMIGFMILLATFKIYFFLPHLCIHFNSLLYPVYRRTLHLC